MILMWLFGCIILDLKSKTGWPGGRGGGWWKRERDRQREREREGGGKERNLLISVQVYFLFDPSVNMSNLGDTKSRGTNAEELVTSQWLESSQYPPCLNECNEPGPMNCQDSRINFQFVCEHLGVTKV